MKLHNVKLKWVLRKGITERGIFRICRLVWQRGRVGDGKGYSAMFTLALTRKLFQVYRDGSSGWYAIIAGIRLHYQRAMGGIHV